MPLLTMGPCAMYGLPVTHQALPLLSLKMLEMQRMLLEDLMGGMYTHSGCYMTYFTWDFSKYHLFNLRMVCGRRVRVEPSCGTRTGRFGGFGPPSRSRSRPFHPEDRCYECGDRGHYARDCSRFRRGSRRYVPEQQLHIFGILSVLTNLLNN